MREGERNMLKRGQYEEEDALNLGNWNLLTNKDLLFLKGLMSFAWE